MRFGRMRNGFCWSVVRFGVWIVVGRAGGLSSGILGVFGSRRRYGRLPRVVRRIFRDVAL